MVFTKEFHKLISLSSVVFVHALAGLFFGNPRQEVHIIIACILVYFTAHYFIDEIGIFSRVIQRETEYWEKKFSDWLR